MNSFERAMRLYAQSFAVLRQQEGMLLFPVLSAISAVLLGASFFVPLHLVGSFQLLAKHQAGWMDYAPLVSWYFANTFIVVFFNSALVACAAMRLAGGNPTVMDGITAAFDRIHRILAWTLLCATVGLLLRAIEERSKTAGKMVAAFMGVAWTAVTYLAIPVIVLEDRSVGASVTRSAQLFRKTWGEQLMGGFGFGLVTALVALPGLGIALLLCQVSLLAAAIVAVVDILVVAAVSSAIRGIFTVALYRYAVEGKAPYGFTPDVLSGGQSTIRDAIGDW
jgi:Family of unknown function (DUF6159)